MTRNEVHEQIVNCHCRLRKRIHNSTVNKKAKKRLWSFDYILHTEKSSAANGQFLDWSLCKLKQF